MINKLGAEVFGTFWLVFGGCGSAVFAAAFPELGIGFVGVSLAFGLTVLTMAYAVGHISGGHFNPAVSVGLAVGGRFSWGELAPYIIAQLAGAILAATVLYLILSGKADFAGVGGFASNGYGELSPGKYSMMSALMAEIVLTAFFLIIILGATDSRAPAGFAPIAIGMGLTLIHLISIPITNTSGKPRAVNQPSTVRRRRCNLAIVVVLGSTGHRCSDWGSDLQGIACRRRFMNEGPQAKPCKPTTIRLVPCLAACSHTVCWHRLSQDDIEPCKMPIVPVGHAVASPPPYNFSARQQFRRAQGPGGHRDWQRKGASNLAPSFLSPGMTLVKVGRRGR